MVINFFPPEPRYASAPNYITSWTRTRTAALPLAGRGRGKISEAVQYPTNVINNVRMRDLPAGAPVHFSCSAMTPTAQFEATSRALAVGISLDSTTESAQPRSRGKPDTEAFRRTEITSNTQLLLARFLYSFCQDKSEWAAVSGHSIV